ncbi:MAG: hypothetical protein GY714_23110 [Desulfobacterales bacterium]|nr:hypothetical protein [Desulfobacterales bacterium]MCP4163118.1 hypothetical protein [Deltaproteobacteria bacterium]
MDIKSFENELKELSDKEIDLEWYFGHTRDWLNESELGQDKKNKIQGLTDFLDY